MVRRSLLTLALPLIAVACTSSPAEDIVASEDAIHLEEAPLPTALTELEAGFPYLPGIDEAPLMIGEPCVASPKVTITTGAVGSTAAVVQSRDSLSRELGFGIEGTIPVAGGITGAAGLTYTTSFDNQSAAVLFQSTGTYDSVLTGASSVTSFDESSVARCGYGYIARASHRVTAALVVTVRSVSSSKDTKANVGAGKSGVAEAKANISNLIQRGQVEIAIHFATDVIPKLPQAPFADSVIVVGSTDADKQKAQEKLDRSLSWLAQAQSTIESYLLDLRSNPLTGAPAPTQSISFRYYPSTPSDVRTAVDRAAGVAADTRTALRKSRAFIERWEQFGQASFSGTGYEWNVPSAPAKTVADLDRLRQSALGKLKPYEQQLSDNLDGCLSSLRNDRAAIASRCLSPTALPLDERSNDIRRIAYLSIDEVKSANPGCPGGQRFPKESEAAIFSPWSLAHGDEGIWTADGKCTWSHSWLQNGALGCSSAWGGNKGLRICLSSTDGPFTSAE